MPQPVAGRTLDDARKGERPVDFALEGVHAAAIYDGDALEPGMELSGPAIVETRGSTTVVHPGNHVVVDDYGNLIITINPDAEDGAR